MHRTTQTDTRWLDLDQLNCVIYTWFVQSRYSLGSEVCIHHTTAVYVLKLFSHRRFHSLFHSRWEVQRQKRFKNSSKVLFIIPLQYLFAIGFRCTRFELDSVVLLKCCIIVVRREHNQYLVFGVSLPPVYLHWSPNQYDSKGISQYEWDWSFNVITVTHTFSYEKVAYG